MMIRCILYPGAKIFSAAGGKSQSAGILSEKVHELCALVPALYNEINWSRGIEGSKESKDYCLYKFKNGSQLDNIAANEKARGKRRHACVLEECVGIDQKILQEVLIPILAISRKAADGTKDKQEALNRAQCYITTAGYKATFAYDKLIQTLVKMIINPDEAFVLGGTYKIPVLTGQYEKTFVQDQKRDDTFDEAAFGREYRRFVLFKLSRIAGKPLEPLLGLGNPQPSRLRKRKVQRLSSPQCEGQHDTTLLRRSYYYETNNY